MTAVHATTHDLSTVSDVELHEQACRRSEAAIREITRRYNRPLFRACLSILKSRSDAEEAVQDAYVKAFTSVASFSGSSPYATWITRIAINEALDRRRVAKRRAALFERHAVAEMADYRARLVDAPLSQESPEQAAARAQISTQLERSIALLPDPFRTVFVLRDVEGMSVDETAQALAIPPQTVKTRLLRARRRLQEILAPDIRALLQDTFPFGGARCAALTERVLAKLFHHQ